MSLRAPIACILLSLSAAANASWCRSEHFQPLRDYGHAFHDSSPVTEYQVAGREEELTFQVIEYQTFERGYEPVFAVSLVSAENGHYRVVLVRAKRPESKGQPPKAVSSDREIGRNLAERISTAGAAILRNTRYVDVPCGLAGTDGHTIQALTPLADGIGELVGEANSPPQGSEAASIRELGWILRKYVEGATTEAEVEAAVAVAERHNNSSKPLVSSPFRSGRRPNNSVKPSPLRGSS